MTQSTKRYDAYGDIQSDSLTPELTAVFDNTDTTGLTHLGNGRYDDPSLGRPLQPSAHGGIPLVPQSLNRYAASGLGQVGVIGSIGNDLFALTDQMGFWRRLGLTAAGSLPGAVAGALAQYTVTPVIQGHKTGLGQAIRNPAVREILGDEPSKQSETPAEKPWLSWA